MVADGKQIFTPSNKDDAAYNLITNLFIYGQNWMISTTHHPPPPTPHSSSKLTSQ